MVFLNSYTLSGTHNHLKCTDINYLLQGNDLPRHLLANYHLLYINVYICCITKINGICIYKPAWSAKYMIQISLMGSMHTICEQWVNNYSYPLKFRPHKRINCIFWMVQIKIYIRVQNIIIIYWHPVACWYKFPCVLIWAFLFTGCTSLRG